MWLGCLFIKASSEFYHSWQVLFLLMLCFSNDSLVKVICYTSIYSLPRNRCDNITSGKFYKTLDRSLSDNPTWKQYWKSFLTTTKPQIRFITDFISFFSIAISRKTFLYRDQILSECKIIKNNHFVYILNQIIQLLHVADVTL